MLKNTETKSIETFIEEFQIYRSKGGEKKFVCFIDKDLLETIKEFELGNPNASDTDVYHFLKQDSKARSAKEIFEYLSKNVGIDPRATTGAKCLMKGASITGAKRMLLEG